MFNQPVPGEKQGSRAGRLNVLKGTNPSWLPQPRPPAPAAAENFAALFEESLARQEMRQGELITAEVTRVDYNVVVVNAGLKSESFIPIEEFKNDAGEVEVKAGDFVTVAIESIEDGYGTTQPVARQGQAPQGVARPRSLDGAGLGRLRPRHQQGQGRPDRHDQRHPRVPARLARRHPPGQGHDAVREQAARVQGHQARPQAQQRRRVAPRRARGEPGRGAREAAVDAVRGRDRQGHRQEHHRLRRVRGPGRHRRPVAHHRSRMAPRQASVGSAGGRRRSHREGAQVRPGEEPRLARLEATRRGPVGRPVATLSAGNAPVRQGHEHHRLRRVRRDRVGHRGPGPRVGNGLDQQEHPSDQGRAARRRGRGDDPRDRRGPPPRSRSA